MRNPLTFRIESWVGGALVLGFSSFLVGIYFTAIKNFNSDIDIMNSLNVKIRIISPPEKNLIDEWLAANDVGLSVKDVGYRYIIKNFPDKPWYKK